MKTVILAGGLGTRLSEETQLKPKPMVEVGGKPLIWHIMRTYSFYGFNEFYVALGYKGEVIKRYFLDYYHLQGDLHVNLERGEVQRLSEGRDNASLDWQLHLIDTGVDSLTGGRVFRLKEYLKNETFMLTYGDGLSNVNINKLLAFHRAHGKLATVSAVRPPARFGAMVFEGDTVVDFKEKPQMSEGWINGGFFVFEPQVLELFNGDDCVLERDPLENLVRRRELVAYKHTEFWQCMDTLRDKNYLEHLWQTKEAPWKVWKES